MILGIIGVVPRAEGWNSFIQAMGCAQPSPSACTWHAPFLKDNHGVSIFKHQNCYLSALCHWSPLPSDSSKLRVQVALR